MNNATPVLEVVIICPVFNEEKTISLFFERILSLKAKIKEPYELKLAFIDNYSSDSTPAIIRKLTALHDWVGYLRLSKNYGYQRSIESGLRSVYADYYCIIDVDCEDPPEMLVDFLKYTQDGYEVVYGERIDREEPVVLKWVRQQYYHVTKFAADEQFNLYMAEFSLFSRVVRDALILDNNSFPFFRASIARVGFPQKPIPYKRHPRIAGETHYNFFSMFSFGIAGLLSSSTLLLRFTVYIFLPWVLAINSLFLLGFLLGSTTEFWLAVWIAFLYFGLALMSISIYVARIYKNTLFRPNFFVDQKKSVLRSFMKVSPN